MLPEIQTPQTVVDHQFIKQKSKQVFKQTHAVALHLRLQASVLLPLPAVVIVLFPLLTGWGGTMSVVVVEPIP